MPQDQVNSSDIASVYKEKTILITGSVGTVGSEVLKQLLAYKPAEIRLFDNSESALFMQVQEHRIGTKITPFFGDLRDYWKLQSAMEGVDVVFLCECTPFDSVRTNVIGTQNVLKAAHAAKVGRLLYISSDKAVNPTKVMDTLKLLAERMVTASCLDIGLKRQIFASTRFSNVLGSNGSVIPFFMDQIKRGGPVTVTDLRMTRFVMTVEEAARLVIKGAATACGGEVFVTKMPVIGILELAQALIEVAPPAYGYRTEDISIEFMGARPGEKVYEELMSEDESGRALELADMFAILPVFRNGIPNVKYNYPSLVSDSVDKPYHSQNEKVMTKDEIIIYLLANNVLGPEITFQYTHKSPFPMEATPLRAVS